MTKRERARLVTAPRLYINAAIIIGGIIGFFVQAAMNMDNEGAFIITGAFCFIAVIIVNFAWLYHVRRQEKQR
ncbi:MAG TPA: hypothetical protein VJZ27_08270 [Aggregatilineales bacterium]|nr:hypothetical protein [Aggregatilineales bacterium]